VCAQGAGGVRVTALGENSGVTGGVAAAGGGAGACCPRRVGVTAEGRRSPSPQSQAVPTFGVCLRTGKLRPGSLRSWSDLWNSAELENASSLFLLLELRKERKLCFFIIIIVTCCYLPLCSCFLSPSLRRRLTEVDGVGRRWAGPLCTGTELPWQPSAGGEPGRSRWGGVEGNVYVLNTLSRFGQH